MVQHLEIDYSNTKGARLAKGLESGLKTYGDYYNLKEEQAQRAKDDMYAKQLGIPEGLSPQMRNAIIESKLKGDIEERKQESKFRSQSRLYEDLLKSNREKNERPEISKENMSQYDFPFENTSEVEKVKEQQLRVPHNPEEIEAMSVVNPQIANTWQRQNEDFYRREQHKEKMEFKKKSELRKEELGFHEESKKYDEDIRNAYKRSVNQKMALEEAEKAIKSGNVKSHHAANLFKGLGPIGDKISNALLNKDQATLQASIPYLIEGWKEIFGVRLSDADLRVIQDKLPEIGKSKESNLAITRVIKKYADISKLRYDVAKKIKKENKNLRPIGFEDMVEEQFQNMLDPVSIINPNTGNVIQIPAYKVSAAIEAGARLANE